MNARIAELHNKVFSTPQGSREREQAINSLSDSERTAVFNLEKDYMLGRITRQDIAEMKQDGNETMTYAQFKKKSDSGKRGVMQELSQFAMKSRYYTSSIGRDTTRSRTSRQSYTIDG